MVGGTRIHRQIHERALVEMKEREEFLLGEENTSPAARTLFVSLDRADAIIEGAPGVVFTPRPPQRKASKPACAKSWSQRLETVRPQQHFCGAMLRFVRGTTAEFTVVWREGAMIRERALKAVLILVGLLFSAGVYPLTMFLSREPALAMMLSLYSR